MAEKIIHGIERLR